MFMLFINDFSKQYEGKQYAQHLIAALKQDYKATLFCSITLNWDYKA
jgi:hypothetical protein